MEQKSGIRTWAEEDRPREKLLLKGRHSLTDAELVAILIGSGNSEESAVELSRRILLHHSNNLLSLSRVNANELMEFRGIGEAKAVSILAALELGRRRNESQPEETGKIGNSRDAASIFQPMLADLNHEEFWVLFLNRANRIIGKEQISMGGMSGTVADPRKIFKAALDRKAISIILCHNHPSGNTNPSEADIRLTRSLYEAGRVLEISVLDHIIIAQNRFYSFADEGKI
ncbi:MAG: JAB domain-containing protein [Bacteroidetes bacterium]|nr:MAG: JAB domain-containing protein [Bacteroidota bacterium]REK05342.1 MAG: JAB domain-containing protein [Bacteroidota bacterium]REK35564.1 MAG: JAB domain-containing protein [Bacteroidota bacterium]REK51729.1 MAG: JAB domain-containing protein [Bacteroidota bacterium]